MDIMHTLDKAEHRAAERRRALTSQLKSALVDTMQHDSEAHGAAVDLLETIKQALEEADRAALDRLTANDTEPTQ